MLQLHYQMIHFLLIPDIHYYSNDIKIGSTVVQTNSFAINLQVKAIKQKS